MTGLRTAPRVPDTRQTMTDAQVLEARALVELAGWTTKEVSERYPMINPRTLASILTYINRSTLIPKAVHLPAGVVAL